jgi:glycine/D-amino acid oxidase-like deaminating enzyme
MAFGPRMDDRNTKLDLRGGRPLWDVSIGRHPTLALKESIRTSILIVGAGITGSFLAEALSRITSSIVVIDRHQPQTASTAASTSLLQWELDTPLRELSAKLGKRKAAQVYQATALAVSEIVDLASDLGIDCDCRVRPSLYISGDRIGPNDLRDEAVHRQAAGLRSHFLGALDLQKAFGLRGDAALFSEGAAEADPVILARGLMDRAISRGTRLFSPETVTDYDLGSHDATVLTESGHEVRADFLILANGYEMPGFVPAKVHRIVSTWVLATRPTHAIWPQRALIWQAATPYLYARPNGEDRIIIGGEDEELTDADARDSKIAAKANIIRRKFKELYPRFEGEIDYAWAGFFGMTSDGLPLIGALPHHRRVFTAFGYGGNGITSSHMAAQLIAREIAGRADPLMQCFAIDRE